MASAQGIRFAKAFIELGLDATLANRKLTKFQKTFKSIGRIGGLATAGVGAGFAALAPAIARSVRLATELQETMSKFGTVFGPLTNQARAFGEAMVTGLGQNRNQIMGMLSGMQDLLVPMGANTTEALQLSKAMTKLSVDLGSFNNMRTEDTFADLQAAITGSGEVMKKYGVVVTEAAVKQKLLDAGMDPKKASTYEKALARIQIIMEGTTAAQGDAERTAGSLANTWKSTLNEFNNQLAEAGKQLLPTITEMLKTVNEQMQMWAGWFDKILAGANDFLKMFQGESNVFGMFQAGHSGELARLNMQEAFFGLTESQMNRRNNLEGRLATGRKARRENEAAGLGLSPKERRKRERLADQMKTELPDLASKAKDLLREAADKQKASREIKNASSSAALGAAGPIAGALLGSTGLGGILTATDFNQFSAFKSKAAAGAAMQKLKKAALRGVGKTLAPIARKRDRTSVETGSFSQTAFGSDFSSFHRTTVISETKKQTETLQKMFDWMKNNGVVFS